MTRAEQRRALADVLDEHLGNLGEAVRESEADRVIALSNRLRGAADFAYGLKAISHTELIDLLKVGEELEASAADGDWTGADYDLATLLRKVDDLRASDNPHEADGGAVAAAGMDNPRKLPDEKAMRMAARDWLDVKARSVGAALAATAQKGEAVADLWTQVELGELKGFLEALTVLGILSIAEQKTLVGWLEKAESAATSADKSELLYAMRNFRAGISEFVYRIPPSAQ